MAVSGSQKTRIGASISAVGAKLTITAKAASDAADLIILARNVARFTFTRIFGRVN